MQTILFLLYLQVVVYQEYFKEKKIHIYIKILLLFKFGIIEKLV